MAVWWWFKSASCGAAAFAAGVLLDCDHLLEYFIHYKLTFNFRAIYDACDNAAMPRLYLFLHSYELLALSWFLIYALSLGPVWISLAAGASLHIILDELTNPIKGLGYFFIYRAIKRFDTDAIIARRKKI